MQKQNIIVVLLLVMALFVGGAMAEPITGISPKTATQDIDATVSGYTVTITAPIDVSGWGLERGENNEKDVGPVYISTTAPSTYEMSLDVAADGTSLHTATPTPLNTGGYLSVITPSVPEVIGETGWMALVHGNIITVKKDVSLTPIPIPIRLRQYVTPEDVSGDYTLKLTYTVSVALKTT